MLGWAKHILMSSQKWSPVINEGTGYLFQMKNEPDVCEVINFRLQVTITNFFFWDSFQQNSRIENIYNKHQIQ